MSEVDQAGAVLQYMELVARGRPPDKEDHESAYETMMSCVKSFGSQMRVLKDEASAGWRGDFNAVLNSAHSMRVVEIDLDDKDPRRQQKTRCDACGRYEHWCGKAIDLAGGSHEPADWMEHCHEIPKHWEDFQEEYELQKSDGDNTKMKDWDLGRFYIGKTCLRQAKLHFIVSTFMTELAYHAWAETRGLSEEENESDGLFTVDDDMEVEFVERRTQLELCVSQRHRSDMPDVLEDAEFWEAIDMARASHDDERDLVDRTEASLKRGAECAGIKQRPPPMELGGESEEDEDGHPFRPGPAGRDGDGDELEEEAGDGDGLSARQREKRPAHTQPPKKRSRVIDDDTEDEEWVPESAPSPAPVATAPRKRVKGVAPTRSSKRQQGLDADAASPTTPAHEVAVAHRPRRAAAVAPAAAAAPSRHHPRQVDDDDDDFIVPDDEEEEDDEDVVVSDLANVHRSRPAIPPSRRASAGPSAQRTATAMRIPPPDGTTAALPGRRAVLLSVMDLARKLTSEGRDGDASTLDAAVVTLRELMEIAERARGTGASR